MFKIKNKIISKQKNPFIIAEIGINHNGSLHIAKKLIDSAVKSGCDAVKFQTYNVDKLVLRKTPTVNYQSKNTNFKNMYELLKETSLTNMDFYKVKKYCDDKKIIFLSTPCDEESAIFLNKLKISAFKISSSDNDNFMLLDLIKKFKKPIILSTGMTLEKELERTIKYINCNKSMLAILHCISDYPTNLKDTQLFNLIRLQKYGYCVGLSDHSLGWDTAICSLGLGCKIIEKHITLDKKMEGPDHASSLECKDLEKFVSTVSNINYSLSGKKRYLTKDEKNTKKLAKKSMYFLNSIEKNSKIKKTDIVVLRPKKNGLDNFFYKKIIGKRVKSSVKKLQIIKKHNIKN